MPADPLKAVTEEVLIIEAPGLRCGTAYLKPESVGELLGVLPLGTYLAKAIMATMLDWKVLSTLLS